MSTHNFKNLKVWSLGMELVGDVYRNVANFPKDEKYGLNSQIKRCAVSIPSNIAEGSGRNTNKDFARFLYTSLGSSYELETQLILAHDFEFLNHENFELLMSSIQEIQKMLRGLIERLIKTT